MSLPVLEHSRLKSRNYTSWYNARKELLQHYNTCTDFTFLSCKVIPKQPLLQLQQSSLEKDVAVYEGESVTVQAQLTNISTIHITSIKVQLADNVTSYQQGLLSQEGTRPLLAYELELDMQRLPVMRMKTDIGCLNIAPDETLSLVVICYGKPGLTQGALNVEYASLPLNDITAPVDRFYTRELEIPFTFNVTACLRCRGWNLLEMPRSVEHWLRQDKRSDGRVSSDHSNLIAAFAQHGDGTTCLLELEIENLSHNQAFKAVFNSSVGNGYSTEGQLEPNTSIRMLLPISRIRLPEEQVSKRIPAPSSRQFVVDKDVLPEGELKRFWYREELLRNVKLTWHEAGSDRFGDCSLRHLRLSEGMLSTLQLSELPLTVEVRQEGELCSQDDHVRWVVKENVFTELSFSVKNLNTRQVTMSAGIEIYAAEHQTVNSLRNVIIDGSPAVLLQPLAAGQEVDRVGCFSLCFMSKGRFSIYIVLEEEGDGPTAGTVAVATARVQHSVHFNVS